MEPFAALRNFMENGNMTEHEKETFKDLFKCSDPIKGKNLHEFKMYNVKIITTDNKEIVTDLHITEDKEYSTNDLSLFNINIINHVELETDNFMLSLGQKPLVNISQRIVRGLKSSLVDIVSVNVKDSYFIITRTSTETWPHLWTKSYK